MRINLARSCKNKYLKRLNENWWNENKSVFIYFLLNSFFRIWGKFYCLALFVFTLYFIAFNHMYNFISIPKQQQDIIQPLDLTLQLNQLILHLFNTIIRIRRCLTYFLCSQRQVHNRPCHTINQLLIHNTRVTNFIHYCPWVLIIKVHPPSL